MKKKKTRSVAWALSMLLGFACALVLGALFYAAMVYQIGGEEVRGRAQGTAQEAQAEFPGPLLALPGELLEEIAYEAEMDGIPCRIVARAYNVGGVEAVATSATSTAYMASLAKKGYVPQLISGFSLAGLDAVCERKDAMSVLVARDGDLLYMLETPADEQTLYALGASASLQEK